MKNSLARFAEKPANWLVTGAAGFIGSNLLEALLNNGQRVVGLDNFLSGTRNNLSQVRESVGSANWANFRFVEGDIRDPAVCREACAGADFVLHHAGLGSVQRSFADPAATNSINIDGFLNVLVAARDAGVKRFIYAGSSSTYGDHPGLPKVEGNIGSPLSPYAVTKYVNELYADVFARSYGMEGVGLRYFNVFGPRQDSNGPYAAVIPKWIGEMVRGEEIYIYGDGETSRDFCHVENAVLANILAATTENPAALNQVYNVAAGERTTLNQLFDYLKKLLEPRFSRLKELKPIYREFRPGDVRHSLADISKARALLGYAPILRVQEGLVEALEWYLKNLG